MQSLSDVWNSISTHWRDVPLGVAIGSLFAVAVLSLKPTVLVRTVLLGRVARPLSEQRSFRGALLITLAAVAALVLPHFVVAAVRLFRSWSVGLVRPTTLLWAIIAFCYCVPILRLPTHYLILSGVVIHVIAELVPQIRLSRTRKSRPLASSIRKWTSPTKVSEHGVTPELQFDNPIVAWSQDIIGRRDFVENVLVRVLIDGEPVVAITAGFGEGKSSIMNLIQVSIEAGGEAIAVPFRAWLPGNESTFVESLFETATAMIRRRFVILQLRSTLLRYGRLVSGVMSGRWSSLRQLIPPESQAQQIDDLIVLFARLPLRVVFLIDEVDRMHLEELIVLLKVIRGAPEIPNLCFVCALNREHVAEMISGISSQSATEYLNKFFPVQLSLPKVDEELLYNTISTRISTIVTRDQASLPEESHRTFDHDFAGLWHQTLKSRLTNFRALGQLLRSFDTSLHLLGNEVNPFDLLVIEIIRLLLPQTHEFVYRNGRYFCDVNPRPDRWGELPFDRQERNKVVANALDAYFQSVEDGERDLAMDLLSRIFPNVSSYARSKGNHVTLLMISGNASTERRIYYPDFFPRYFIYTVPQSSFGEREMDDFVLAVQHADQKQLTRVLDSTYAGLAANELRRLDFWERLIARIGRDISLPQAEWLAYRAAELTKDMESDFLGMGEWGKVRRVVFACCAKGQGSSRLQEILVNTIKFAGSDRFASDIVFYSTSNRQGNNIISDWTGVAEDNLHAAYAQRMRAHHTWSSSASLVLTREDILAFTRWTHYVPADKSYVIDYFRQAFDTAPNNVGTFLLWLLPGNVGYEGSAIRFVDSIYPVAEVVQRLQQAAQNGVEWSTDQREAVERFWEFLRQEPKPDETNAQGA